MHERVYRLLLHAYPAGFREEYEGEMMAAFRRLRQSEPVWALWPMLVADLARSAIREHVDTLGRDLRYTGRKLAATPGLVLAVMLILGSGIGANIAVYSLVDALLFRPLAAGDPEQLITVQRGEGRSEPASYPDYKDYRGRSRTLAGLAAWVPAPMRLDDGGHEQRVMGEIVSGNFFEVLRLHPVRGRLLGEADDGEPGTNFVVVISHALWNGRFGGQDVTGRTLRVNGRPMTVIGVAPEGFRGASVPIAVDAWIPLSMYGLVLPAIGDRNERRGSTWLALMGRLGPEAGRAEAEAELNWIESQIQAEHPELARTPEEQRSRRLTLIQPRGIFVAYQRRVAAMASALMMAATLLLVVMGCANAANLLLARSVARAREVAVRLALGASRRRLMRQLVTESVTLAILGAGAGAVFAFAALRIFGDLRTPIEGAWQYSANAAIDHRVLFYTLVVSLVTGMAFGLAPARRLTSLDVYPALKEGGVATGARATGRLRRGLVTVQLALSIGLLVSMGLLGRSLHALHTADPGFETSRQLIAGVDFLSVNYTVAQKQQFVDELRRRVRTLPGVVTTAWSRDFVPLNLSANLREIRAAGPGGKDVAAPAGYAQVDADFLPALGIPVLRGRGFHEGDPHGTMVINETMARRLWPKADPVGRRVRVDNGGKEGVVIGVARNAKYHSLGEEQKAFVYELSQEMDFRPTLFVKTAGEPEQLVRAVAAEVKRLDPELEVRFANPLSANVEFARWPTRLAVKFLGAFSVVGLILAATGVYAMMSFLTSLRRQEVGIRMAMGASARQVRVLVIRGGARLAATGIAIGGIFALGLGRLIRGLLAGVSPWDPLTYAAVAVVLGLVVVAASWLPAERASRMPPMEALREE